MHLIKSCFVLVTVACLASTPASAASQAPAAANMPITLAQADAVITQNGFTPVGQPKQKGNIIGSLARLGDKAFIVTVDAQTGQFLDAKATTIALPPLAASAAPAAPVATPRHSAAAAPVANSGVSPVKRAADLARSKGFRVLSFRYRGGVTSLVARRGNGLFSIRIDDNQRILSIAPVRNGDD